MRHRKFFAVINDAKSVGWLYRSRYPRFMAPGRVARDLLFFFCEPPRRTPALFNEIVSTRRHYSSSRVSIRKKYRELGIETFRSCKKHGHGRSVRSQALR